MKTAIRFTPVLIGALGAAALSFSTLSPALADDCQAIKSAQAALQSISYSTVTTNSNITVRNVFTATRVYSQVEGKWSSDPRPPLKQRLQELDEQMKPSTCAFRRTKTEMIGGQAADVYTDADSSSKDFFWISKSTNLPLKMSLDQGGLGRDIITYSYGNVQVPPGVR
jgi:outer membrane lipoprotein-sorting protein